MALIGLFPGQGSQVVGMGKDLAESFDQAKIMFQMADKALGFPLSKLAFEGPIEELTLTKNAQPAILCVSVCAHLLSNPPLDVVAGHSLGEYSALVATGSITFEDAVQLVHKRGSYMQEAVPEGEGAMVAVMGPTPDELGAIVDQISDEIIELANLNCPGQTVVSGSAKGVAAFSEKAQASGAKVIPLQVSAPFHSTLMKPAAESLAKDLSAISFKRPRVPVINNVTASATEDPAEIHRLLIEQVYSPVRWTESMQYALDEYSDLHTIEFGPGGVLTKLMKRIQKGVPGEQIFDTKTLEAYKASQ